MNPADSDRVASKTFRIELLRAVSGGMVETVLSTFAILVVVKFFQAPDSAKELMLGAARAGLVTSIFAVPLLKLSRLRDLRLASLLLTLASVAFAVSATAGDSLGRFSGGVGAAMFLITFAVPLYTRVYRRNYPESRRGKLFSVSGIVRALVAIVFSFAAGKLLDHDPGLYPVVFGTIACGCLGSALLLLRIPYVETEVEASEGAGTGVARLVNGFRGVGSDKVFLVLLLSWMVMGIANMIAMALHADYFANPERGHGLSATWVAALTAVVPQIAKLSTTYFWGVLFDRINFFVIRFAMNVFCILSVLLVFFGNGPVAWAIGMASFGVSLGGGNIAWNLWVTKVAPADRVGEYMSVHTFSAGIRGVAAPFIAFPLIEAFGPRGIGSICAVLIVLGTVLLIPWLKEGEGKRRTGA